MKRIPVLILVVTGFFNSSAQIITGYVSDQNTGMAIADALVCFDGTMHGTRTNRNGYFNLDISFYKSRPLSVCSAGYYTVSFDIETPGRPVQIFLKQKRFTFNAADSIITNEEARLECIKQFRGTFIGKTPNARDCEIRNEADLKFVIRDSVMLIAFIDEPLEIINKSLGYQILYFLDDFKLALKQEVFSFSGTLFFSDDLSAKDNTGKGFTKKREQAYLASRMYFFRTLWENRLDEEGIILKNYKDDELSYNKVVMNKGNAGKYLKHYGNEKQYNVADSSAIIYIVYRYRIRFYNSWGRIDSHNLTQIVIHNETYFDESGYFDPTGITWRGNLAEQRIADLLPLEYE